MTPKERFYARLEGKPVDKIPNLNITMLFAAKHAGVPYGKFCEDYNYMVEAQGKSAVDFGIDILSTMSDPYRETYDYGAEIEFPEDNLPLCKKHLISSIADFDKIKKFDPLKSTRILDRINAVRLYKSKFGDEYPILGWVEGPMAELADLTGVSESMMYIMDDPDACVAAMEKLTDQAIDCALIQIDSGADIIGIGDAVASLISEDWYMEYIQPLETKLIKAIHKAGAKVKLHICGNVSHILAGMIETGADIVDIDYMVDFEKSIKLADGRCTINGNVDPTAVMLSGTVDEVKAAVKTCMALSDNKFMISAGCEIPRDTSIENLITFNNVLLKV